MSEVLRDLVVSLSLDGDNFSRNLTSINKQIQEAESEFRRAASGVDNFEKSVSGTQSQLSSLQQKLALQQKAVKQYERALEAANKKLENAYARQGRLTESLDAAKQKNADLKQQVPRPQSNTNVFPASWASRIPRRWRLRPIWTSCRRSMPIPPPRSKSWRASWRPIRKACRTTRTRSRRPAPI